MSIYNRQLPAAFPIMLEVSQDVARAAVAILMLPFMGGQDGAELTYGSSFAHTADSTGPDGTRRLCLSRASLQRLLDHGMFAETPELREFLYKK